MPKAVWKEPVETLLSLGSLYFSFSSMRNAEGQKVALKNRDKVVQTLHELNSKVALPICRHFGLRYNFFSEHHPQAKKAGVTCKEPLILRKQGPDGTEIQETRYLVTIRLRLRLHPTKGDPQSDFLSHGTQIAVLLHELCHLKHMNHGKDFMLFLRDIFAFAQKLGVFEAGESNEIPSPWPWENVIFQRAGNVSDDELLQLFAEHREKQRQAKTPEEALKAAEVEAAELEAVSTSASDEPSGAPERPKLALVAAFNGGHRNCPESCDGCENGAGEPTEIAYGEETDPASTWISKRADEGEPFAGPHLPPLARSPRPPLPGPTKKLPEKLPPIGARWGMG